MPDREREHDDFPSRIRARVQQAAARFGDRFGRPATVGAVAPGRVNLIGEHTDYNQGFVLPIAIERETIIVADRTAGDASTIVSDDLPDTIAVDLTRPLQPRPGKPDDYLLGVADQFQHRGFALTNLDAVVTSTVPIGAGLSSSAAVEVAFAVLLANLLQASMTPLEIARLCQAAEHAFPGTPVGIMDMYISATAKAGHALLIDCRSEEARPVPADFARLGAKLLVIDTGVKHTLATSAYAQRRADCLSIARLLGLPSLRSATVESLNAQGLPALQRLRALHVVTENMRTVLAAEALVVGDLERLGELMLQSHASLRDLYEVTCPELDVLVDTARTMRERGEGVFGARMTGGGFGGCVIVLCRTEAIDEVSAQLNGAFMDRFARSPARMFATAAATGARIVSLKP